METAQAPSAVNVNSLYQTTRRHISHESDIHFRYCKVFKISQHGGNPVQFVCSNSIQKILVHDIVLCLKSINLLTTTIIAPPSNASKWQMGFNSAFKGLKYINIMKLNVYCI